MSAVSTPLLFEVDSSAVAVKAVAASATPLTLPAKISALLSVAAIVGTGAAFASFYATPYAPPTSSCSASIEQVHVHLGAVPSTTLHVAWASPRDCAGGAPRVEYGASAAALAFSAPAAAVFYSTCNATENARRGGACNATTATGIAPYDSPLLLDAPIDAASAGVGPGGAVYYRVGDDSCGFSCVYATATAPAPGFAGAPTRLAVVGDVGATNFSAATLAGVLASHAVDPFSAALLVGDLSYANGNQPIWDAFGRVTQFLATTVPVMSLPGNHEWFDDQNYAFVAYYNRFGRSLPIVSPPTDTSGLYYSFDAGLIHVVMLAGYCQEQSSAYTQPCLAEGTLQRSWLEGDLARANANRASVPWVVVSFHQPFANSNSAHPIAKEGVPTQQAIEALLYASKVDVVLSGHVHAYQRSCKLYNYSCVDDGVLYLTVGDGGTPEGLAPTWVDCPSWSIYQQASWGHGEMTALNATHLSWEWHQNEDLTPARADAAMLVKGRQLADAGQCREVQPQLTEAGRKRREDYLAAQRS